MRHHDPDRLILGFYCKDPASNQDNECATFYRTNRESWVVHGDRLDSGVSAQLRALAEHETYLEIPEALAERFTRMYARERYGVDLPEDPAGEPLAAGEPNRPGALACAESDDPHWRTGRHASTVSLPGCDFWLLDGEVVVLADAEGESEIRIYRDPDVVAFCRRAFTLLRTLAVPHREYRPA